MIDVERALFDLAEHLDHPVGDGLGAAVRSRISVPARPDVHHPGRRLRTLVAIAAVIVAIIAAVVVVAPARHAIADWLGIGAVEVRVADHPLPTGTSAHPVPGAPDATTDPRAVAELAAARRAVGFPIATPRAAAAGALAGVEVDDRVRDGLVELRYARFTLVELASNEGGPVIGKVLGPAARVEPTTVAGRPGLWIVGAHQVGYLDRRGAFETDTVRRSGPVLLWERAGVTYRIEGLARQTDAQAIARSVR